MNDKLPDRYTGKEVFLLLVSRSHLPGIVEDWCATFRTCDLRLRMAKTKGCRVIETKDIIFTSRILQHYPNTKVVIRMKE